MKFVEVSLVIMFMLSEMIDVFMSAGLKTRASSAEAEFEFAMIVDESLGKTKKRKKN